MTTAFVPEPDEPAKDPPASPPAMSLGRTEISSARLPFTLPEPSAQRHEMASRSNGSNHHTGEELSTALEAAHHRALVGVSVVIPAKNEGKNLPYVIDRLPSCVDEIIVVDSSSDVTPLILRESCREDVKIIPSPNAGKGNALRLGFAAARGELIIAMDADGSMAPEEIPQFIYFLEHGYDLVKGSRFIGGGGSLDITPIRRAGSRMLLAVANLLYDTNLTDLCYGYFAFRRCFLDHLALCSSGFEIDAEVTVRAVLAGMRVCEVPCLEMPRRRGHSNLHAIHDGQRLLTMLLQQRPAGRVGGARVEVATEREQRR